MINYASKNKTSVKGYIPFTYLLREYRVTENLNECNHYLFYEKSIPSHFKY